MNFNINSSIEFDQIFFLELLIYSYVKVKADSSSEFLIYSLILANKFSGVNWLIFKYIILIKDKI